MICSFESNQTHYASVTSDPEYLLLEWDSETGALSQFTLLHGPDKVPWILSTSEPSIITQDGNYYEVNLRITIHDLDVAGEPPNVFKGKIMVNAMSPTPPGGVLAAIWEGTGAYWYVATGSLDCV